MKRRVRTAMGLGVLAAAGVWACGNALPVGPEEEEPSGSAGQAIMDGKDDDAATFRSVVHIGGGLSELGCSGTLIGLQTVLTAAHCFTGGTSSRFNTSCDIYAPTQPECRTTPAPVPNLMVSIPDPLATGAPVPDGSAPGDPFGATAYHGDVDGLIINPDWVTANPASPDSGPDIPGTCCGGALPCAQYCGLPYASAIGDIAILHLAKPVPPNFAVPAFSVLAAIAAPQGTAPPWTKGAYPVNLAGLVGGVVMMAGTSGTNNHQGDDWRAYGATTIASLTPPDFGGAAVACTGLNTTPPQLPTLNSINCTNCFLNWTSAPTAPLLADGGACGIPGDSGGPALLGTRGYAIGGISGIVIAGVLSTAPSAGPGCNGGTSGGRYAATWDTSDATRVYPRGTWILRHLEDFDNDGVPDEHDNCKVAPNPDQANCNKDAEDKYGYPNRGDACDPIPCPAAESTGSNVVGTFAGTDAGAVEHGVRRRDALNVEFLASHSATSGAHMGKPVAAYTSETAETGYRYCVNRLGVVCSSSVLVDDVFYPMADGTSAFYRAHLHGTGFEPGGFVETRTYDDSSIDRTWSYQSDYLAWRSAGYIPATATNDGVHGYSTGMTGRFWSHSTSSVGRKSNQHGTGCAVNLSGVGDGDHLSNHYETMAPDARYDANIIGAFTPTPWWWWMVDEDGDPGPDGDPIPAPWLGTRAESALLMSAGGHFAILNHGGKAVVVDAQISARVATLASQGAKFVPSAEPSLAMAPGGYATAPRALAVAANGTDVVAAITRQAGDVGAAGPVIGTTEDFGGASVTRAGGPAARSGFRAAYARSIDTAFIIGGTLGTTTNYAADVWARPVTGSGAWAKLATGTYAPQKVLAATYSFRDARLWILDELVVNRATTARLVRLDLTTGTPIVVGQWTRGTGWDSQWLVADLDGHVLLFSSSASTNRHAVARLRSAGMSSDATIAVERFAVETGFFPFAPTVDVAGYAFPVRSTTPGGLYTYDPGRRTTLPGVAGTLSSVAQML